MNNEKADFEKILLNGKDWFLFEDHQDFRSVLETGQVPDRSCIPAEVPGNIQADLEAAHVLSPLWYGAGDPGLEGAADKNWWYIKEFLTPESCKNRRVRLYFGGVDHECQVFLNGVLLGGNAGMFKRFGFDVADKLTVGGSNRIAVRISRMPEELAGQLPGPCDKGGKKTGDGTRMVRQVLKDLKSPTNNGWDWAVPVYTLGIWKEVWLECSGSARIEWVRIQTRLTDDQHQSVIQVKTEIDSLSELAGTVEFSLKDTGSNASKRIDCSLRPGNNLLTAELILDEPKLWWPKGFGDQPIYRLETVIRDHAGILLHARTTRFGIREISWGQVEGAPADFINPSQMWINGLPVRMMGSNLIPPDILFGRMNRRGIRLIRLAAEAGINTFRVWGGGVTLTEEMYDLADELGIMLFQEFMLANAWPETDAVFLHNLETSITNVIKQLVNHPCIVEWSGGNEMPWQSGTDHLALKLLERLVAENDNRIFRATDPIQGWGKHGTYTYVYSTRPAPYLTWLGGRRGETNLYQAYNGREQMRLGEFGTNSPANLEIWQREIPPASQWPLDQDDDPVLIRKNVFWGAAIAENWLHKEITESIFGPLASLESLVEAGQFLGAEGLRYAMDELRRNGRKIGGFMSWDYNEPWPNGAGSYMVDYDGRPLMNYDFVKQALAPVSLSLKYDSLLYDPEKGLEMGLLLVSDSTGDHDGMKWSWIARDLAGSVLGRSCGSASIGYLDVLNIGSIVVPAEIAGLRDTVVIETELRDNTGTRVMERVYIFGNEKAQYPLAGLLKFLQNDQSQVKPAIISVGAVESGFDQGYETLRIQVANTGQMTALFCEPHPMLEYRTDIDIANNHISIPPGEHRTIEIKAPLQTGPDLTLLQTGWILSCWNADDCLVPASADVLFSLGRRDSMCREYAGYFQDKPTADREGMTPGGNRIDGAQIHFQMNSGKQPLTFLFHVDGYHAGMPSRLRIHTADQSRDMAALIQVSVNQSRYLQTLPRGLGIQAEKPFHLAFPASAIFELPAGVLLPGENKLEIQISNDGWFTWDAMELVSLKQQEMPA